MPKGGLPASEWRRRLRAFADRRFVFSRGQHPPKNSPWSREVQNIERCPRQANRARLDLFGAPILCRCGYHATEVQSCVSAEPVVRLSGDIPEQVLKDEWFSEEMPMPEFVTTTAAETSSTSASKDVTTESNIQNISAGILPEEKVDLVKLGVDVQQESPPVATAAESPQDHGKRSTILTEQDSHASEYLDRIPVGWDANMKEGDRLWVAKALFARKGQLKEPLQLWYHPPPMSVDTAKPNVIAYFHQRLFVWMPRRMFRVDFHCPTCNISLRSKGIYHRVRPVVT